eukprot:TRINITY_DN11347_c0_g1_i3.p3 TRINITY_DN11347_c0_g1~~TRINITY_DN11347_c0_g1_i3.p3  ORF type:complete len:140 (+),score=28.18 TRINITY_DN11347_c0_g1_i3:288-707(+)
MTLIKYFLLIILLDFLFFAQSSSCGGSWRCCHRKPNFGCCGNGACNEFCCNCEGGCNEQCQKTTCGAAQWTQCAAIVANCVDECIIEVAALKCALCMGELYEHCGECVVPIEADQKNGVLRPEVFIEKEHKMKKIVEYK